MIAHYHWQVGLVADGRLLAAAAAASSDTTRGLACSARVSLLPPPTTSCPTSRRQEDLRVRAGSCRTQGRPPPSGSHCGPWAVGRARRGARTPLPLPPIPFSLAACSPRFLPASPSKPGVPGSLAGWFPRRRGGGGASSLAPGPRPQALSQGSQHRGAAARPSSRLFLKCLQIQKQFRNAFRLGEPEDLG